MLNKPKNQHMRVAFMGLLVNLGLSGLKVGAGIIGRSRAVLADGIHSLSDVATDIGVLFSARYCSKPADREHPYGHGRLDVLISLGIALLMVVASLGLLVSSVDDLRREAGPPPGLIALYAALGSLICKEILFQWTRRRSRELRSPSLQANAWHHRSDAFSSIPVIIAVFVSRNYPAWHFLDSLGGLMISAIILKMAWNISGQAVAQLTDRAASNETVNSISRLTGTVDGVREVHNIRTRSLGNGLSVDLHVLVDARISVQAGHQIADSVKSRLLQKGPDIVDVVVHIEPAGDDGRQK